MSYFALGAAAVGLIGNVVSSQGAKSAANKANEGSIEATKLTNASNERLFHEARGSNGHAILPEYFGGFERTLAGDLTKTYNASKGFTNTFGDEAYAALSPAFASGNALIGDVFDNTVYNDRLGNQTAISSARRSGINKGLSERLAAVKARRDAAGLGGGSSVANRLMLGDTIGARQDAAVSDATDLKNLYDENVNLKLQLLDAPLTRANASYSFGYAPEAAKYLPLDQWLQRGSFFNIGTGQPYAAQTPTLQTVPSNNQFLGAGITSAASSLGDYYATQQLLKQLNAGNNTATPAATGGTGSNLNLLTTWKPPGG